MPEDGTRAPTGRPTATSGQHPAWWRRHFRITAAGGAVLIAAAGTGAALATWSSTPPRAIPTAHAYSTTTGVLAAMDRGGVVCSDAGPAGEFVDCSGASSGDTVIGMFGNHADAVAYADGMITLGLQLHTPAAEVVGPNWVVNTSPAFAGEVVDAIGGEIITRANAQPPPVSDPASAWPAAVIAGSAQG
jgi:hypothetical protein